MVSPSSPTTKAADYNENKQNTIAKEWHDCHSKDVQNQIKNNLDEIRKFQKSDFWIALPIENWTLNCSLFRWIQCSDAHSSHINNSCDSSLTFKGYNSNLSSSNFNFGIRWLKYVGKQVAREVENLNIRNVKSLWKWSIHDSWFCKFFLCCYQPGDFFHRSPKWSHLLSINFQSANNSYHFLPKVWVQDLKSEQNSHFFTIKIEFFLETGPFSCWVASFGQHLCFWLAKTQTQSEKTKV